MSFHTARFIKARPGSGPTRILYISNAGDALGTTEDELRQVFRAYGDIEIVLVPEKRYSFAVFGDADAAQRAMQEMQAANAPTLGTNGANRIQLQLRFAEEASPPIPVPEPECVSTTDRLEVPGAHIIEDFITSEEEMQLLGTVAYVGEDTEGSPGSDDLEHERNAETECSEENRPVGSWESNLVRRVKHFGFPFNYRTLMLDYAREVPPIPSCCQPVIERMNGLLDTLSAEGNVADGDSSSGCPRRPGLPFSQLTVNEYLPGQGIAQHVDTETCFGPEICILNLGCGITMTLTLKKGRGTGSNENMGGNNNETDVKTAEHSEDGCQDVDSSDGSISHRKKHLWLPPRSLLVLRGDARYKWGHGIACRTCDKVNGVLIPRGRRVSLTFRQALVPGSLPSSAIRSSELEKEHVFRVYDNIAVHWNHTRGKRKVHWPRIKTFIESLPKGSLVAGKIKA
jgi:alkylated DNA repair protein alkB homolog 8